MEIFGDNQLELEVGKLDVIKLLRDVLHRDVRLRREPDRPIRIRSMHDTRHYCGDARRLSRATAIPMITQLLENYERETLTAVPG